MRAPFTSNKSEILLREYSSGAGAMISGQEVSRITSEVTALELFGGYASRCPDVLSVSVEYDSMGISN